MTIIGSGFTALHTSPKIRSNAMRCSFGLEVNPVPPTFHNDTHIVCVTTWGEESTEGLLVGVALNKATAALLRKNMARLEDFRGS